MAKLLPALRLPALLLAGCAAAEVHLPFAEPPVGVREVMRAAPGACVVQGGGELAEDEDDGGSPPAPFSLREQANGKPVLRIVAPSKVAVRWTLEPETKRGLARVELGGQRRVRAALWADPSVRRFQLRAPAYAVPEHAWIEGGFAVGVRGLPGAVRVRRGTGLEAPAHLEAVVPCAEVLYQPLRVSPRRLEHPNGAVQEEPTGPALHLAKAPGGAPVVTLQGLQGLAQGLTLFTLERRDGASLIWVAGNGVGFTGWVPSDEVSSELDVGSFCGGGPGAVGGSFGRVPLYAAQDSPLFVGEGQAPLPDAFIEKGAALHIVEVRGGLARVELADGSIVGEGGLWMARADL